jgi:hypothetical protein
MTQNGLTFECTRSIGEALRYSSGISSIEPFRIFVSSSSARFPFQKPWRSVKIVDAVDGDRRANRRVGFLESELILGIVLGQTDERREVAAGRAAGDDHEIGIRSVLAGVLLHPGQGFFAVAQMVGERRVRAQTVVRADADPAAGGELIHQWERLLAFVADDPTAAVDLEQDRAVRRPGAMAIDVEPEIDASLPVELDVADPLDLGMANRKRLEESAASERLGRSACRGPSGSSSRTRRPGRRLERA